MGAEQLTLAVETSCDETSAALLRGTHELLSHTILSQDIHVVYGGVVPEIASREHLRTIDAVVGATLLDAGITLRNVDLFAATAGPGLIGALLVGLTWTKSAAWSLGRPFIGIHHMEAHLFATELEDPEARPPFIGLLVSGGHTLLLWVPAWGDYQLLGETRDDAVGEAFDKAAKLLGLPYPVGPSIEKAARVGDASTYPLPRPLLHSSTLPGDPDYFDFSYSGLKTALRNRIRSVEAKGALEAERANLAAAFQDAAIEVLVAKVVRATELVGCKRVVLGGGVANSQLLRERLAVRIDAGQLFFPSPRLATDNAAMIARAARFRWGKGESSNLEATAVANLRFPGLSRYAFVDEPDR